ncbi:hypothetical protein SEA_LUMOS_125 [Mycobacterium phage Lumos]|uniref:Helix-turn-helix DNA binding domain protein n=1 Tax=Mycobacterium phage Lumos TaxID=1701852 RepID=A0A0K2CLX1_9CAUD|nr:hypothetical protein J4T93_gp063 [Mycobacterium phage Lumos]ALA06631.1 hypothetical protein SEA_LUMOS_125 [Mycobacterium phage Lumos]
MNVYSPSVTTDATLSEIRERAEKITRDILALYQCIRDAKDNGYSYNELGNATGFPRGTLQNVLVGKTPRFSVAEEFSD